MGLNGWERSPGLFTDLYQLTMAQGYWKSGAADLDACFHLSFRGSPFDGGYAVFSGLEQVVAYLLELHFNDSELDFLRSMAGNDGLPLFDGEFLGVLSEFTFDGDVHAMKEGTVVFPGEPLIRVSGPISTCQIVETALLNMVNFQTLVATKAARIKMAAQGDPVVEFGLRRAQGPNGGLTATRAAYIGGVDGTSNALAAKTFGIPAAGTHAHSWVMAFDSEAEAFDQYARAMPNNCTLLVDTYDTLEGVRAAVDVGRRLAESGHRLIGVRIDSGDLAWLSARAREILDDGGLSDAKIYASNELDEHVIESLKEQGAAIDVWGVGTKLVTAWDQPALGGVYKLSAIRRLGEEWTPRIKISEQTAKVTTPGVLGVRRYRHDGAIAGDMVYELGHPPAAEATMVDPADPTRRKTFSEGTAFEELLVRVFESGKLACELPSLEQSRERCRVGLSELDPTMKRFLNPHTYPVGLEKYVHDLRTKMILDARGLGEEE